jgi:hypothetical protein
MLLSMQYLSALLGDGALDRWNDGGYHTYALLRRGADMRRALEHSTQGFERRSGPTVVEK